MKTIWHDIRYGLRQLRRSPGFTAVAVLSLALGIGANTAIFSLINGILLKSLPVRDPHQLRLINWTSTKASLGTFAFRDDGTSRFAPDRLCSGAFPYPMYRDFAEKAKGFSDIFAFSFLQKSETGATINTGGATSMSDGLMVSGNFFKCYGTGVLIGRPITPEDDSPDAEPVAVITYRLWERCYGLDPNVVGRVLIVDNNPFSIIGVLPRRYIGLLPGNPTEFYVPMAAQPQLRPNMSLTSYRTWWVQVAGRLAPGANEAGARSSLEILFNQALSLSSVEMEQPKILLQDGRQGLLYLVYQKISGPLWLLQGLVSVILLIACANLAGLLLARGAARHHEMAVRAAIGAGRWRLMRQLFTESLVISLLGACFGLVLSLWLKAVVASFLTGSIGTLDDKHFNLRLDMNVLLFTLAISIVTTVLFGLFPALRAASTNPSAGLKDSGLRGTPRLRLGKILVATQVGLSVLLVMGAGLLVRTLINLYQTDLGLDVQNLLVFQLNPLESEYEWSDLGNFYDTVRERIAGIPGVRSVALARVSLLQGGWWSGDISFPERPDEQGLSARYLTVSDGWFTTMGISLLSGRDFSRADTRNSQRVAIVNQTFAEKFFPDENPLGKIFNLELDEDNIQEYQIVGLCRDHVSDDLRNGAWQTMYFYHRQRMQREMTFTIRSVIPPLSLVPAVRKAVATVDRNLPLDDIATQVQLFKRSISGERLFALLCGSLALLALSLSCIGLYGLLAYNVARRTGEMGIRKALGARPWDVARSILREALTLAVIGIAIGIPVALALVHLLRGILFGIEPNDPLTMVGAVVLMLAVATLAAFIPARRAAKIDPMEALRYE
jgi:predicted permease